MTTIHYDVPTDHRLYGKVFCTIDGDDIIIEGKPFLHGKLFVLRALVHWSHGASDITDILIRDDSYTIYNNIYDMWSIDFNKQMKGYHLPYWYDPFTAWRNYSRWWKMWTPPDNKFFTVSYYKGIFMWISPKLTVYVVDDDECVFGKKPYNSGRGKDMNAEEIAKSAKAQKFLPYLKWLEDQKIKGLIYEKDDSFSINQQELKKWIK